MSAREETDLAGLNGLELVISAPLASSAIETPLLAIAEHHPFAAAAMREIDALMDRGHPMVTAFSSGKDSSACASMMLSVARLRKEAHLTVPPMLLTHSDTRVESPVVRALADGELRKMRSYAKAHDLSLDIRIGQPSLYTSWGTRVIGGRGLPSFPGAGSDCSVDWKVVVGKKLIKEAFADLARHPNHPQPVLMTGVRLDESTQRAANITSRGESATQVTVDADGSLRLAPIMHWSADDVFELLGYANAGLIDSYSNFEQTMDFYRSAGGSSCAVVGDLRMSETAARSGGGCGARSGCWTCVKVKADTSAETMIESDEIRFGYLRGLNRLRNYIANTQFDWSLRTFLGRSIDDEGYVAVQADVYSPAMLEKLLRYTLTAQIREQHAASRLGIRPRFSILGVRDIVAIDALWSMYGLHEPFHALFIMKDVEAGNLLDAPIVTPSPRTPVPRYQKLYVGRAWEDDRRSGDPARDRMLSSGIRSPVHEIFAESCGFDVKQAANGELITAWDTDEAFDVDEEGAMDFIDFMGDEMIAKYHKPGVDRTVAVTTYLGYGTITMAHSSLSRWHEIARRTQWMQRHGLVGDVQRETLLAMLETQRVQTAQQVASADELQAQADLDATDLLQAIGLLPFARSGVRVSGDAELDEHDQTRDFDEPEPVVERPGVRT